MRITWRASADTASSAACAWVAGHGLTHAQETTFPPNHIVSTNLERHRPIPVDRTDRQILNIIQSDFPLDPRPYAVLSERLGITEPEILDRVRCLLATGIIRKIGASFDTRRLGHTSILVAAKVPSNRLKEVADIVSSFPEVTHNYGRDAEYNLWFAVVSGNSSALDETLRQIQSATGIPDMHPLPAEKMFKIKVEFEF